MDTHNINNIIIFLNFFLIMKFLIELCYLNIDNFKIYSCLHILEKLYIDIHIQTYYILNNDIPQKQIFVIKLHFLQKFIMILELYSYKYNQI